METNLMNGKQAVAGCSAAHCNMEFYENLVGSGESERRIEGKNGFYVCGAIIDFLLSKRCRGLARAEFICELCKCGELFLADVNR